ncbi:MAG TPA: hypothetical protein VLZ73_08535 [Brevundimonas sp.]|nr:hypothetical protein [Brevundimonas sp.]
MQPTICIGAAAEPHFETLGGLEEPVLTRMPEGSGAGRGRERTLSFEAQAAFLDAIYAAAADPELWAEVFALVERHLGGFGTIYQRSTDDPRSHRLAAASLDPRFFELYNGYYNATNVWATSPKGGHLPLYETEDVIDGSALERTEFYADWLRPQGLKHGLSCRVGGGGGRSLHLGLVREPRFGVYDRGEIHFLRGLAPHLHRAVEISHRLGVAEGRADGSFEALGRLGVAAFLVDGRGVVQSINAAAERLLGEGCGLAVRAGRLTAGSLSGDAVLGRMIAGATGEGRTASGRTGDVVALGGSDPRTALSVTAVPLEERRREAGFGCGPLAVIMVTRPRALAAPSAESLRRRYGLTPAEVRLAAALCGGATLAGYAVNTGTGVTTVKTHLGALFAKVGENRQVDLVRRLLADPATDAGGASQDEPVLTGPRPL